MRDGRNDPGPPPPRAPSAWIRRTTALITAPVQPPAQGSSTLHPLGILLAAAAAVWHAALLSKATNDNFFHMALAKELLAGEWPVRDFFDSGWVLHYVLSAAAHAALGNRLLSEAVLVGAMWAVTTFLVFRLVRRLTGSTWAAALAAVLMIVAGPRGYAYPKGIVYAVAATLWWRYLEKPTVASAVWCGVWAAVAFYWRPDHGLYVAVGIVLSMVAAHGLRTVAIRRCAVAGATAFGLAAPFLMYVQLTVGLGDYVATGTAQGRAEHTTHGTHALPLLRYSDELVTVAPAAEYAPVITIRWSPGSTPASRAAVMERYGLTHDSSSDTLLDRVRLSDRSLADIRGLVNEPVVEDTAGLDRSTSTVAPQAWPIWQRWSFRYPWLRLRLLPRLEPHAKASEILVAFWFILPLLVLVTAGPWVRRHFDGLLTGPRLVTFAAFALVVNVGLLRTPYTARAVDAVVLPSILLACYGTALWRAGASTGIRGRLFRAAAAMLVALAITTVAGASQFMERAAWLAGDWRSLRRARGAWGEVQGRLAASPPLAYYLDAPAGSSVRLAAYVRACLPESERLLVLWFAPEIYYYSDRLMAQRHLVFAPEWAALEHEQRLAMDKIRRFAPPLALARRSSIDSQARATYPAVVQYVENEFVLAGSIDDSGEQYLIFARRDRPAVGTFGSEGWPCYVNGKSLWNRVGQSAD